MTARALSKRLDLLSSAVASADKSRRHVAGHPPEFYAVRDCGMYGLSRHCGSAYELAR
jgi:hypothetical protein